MSYLEKLGKKVCEAESQFLLDDEVDSQIELIDIKMELASTYVE